MLEIGKYFAATEKIDNGPHTWNSLLVSIYRRDKPFARKIGEYTRNYNQLYDTFYPFVKDGQEYALYSRDYTATRVMKLPECEDLGGEERDVWGFCPVEFYVPTVENGAFHLMGEKYCNDDRVRPDGSTAGEYWRQFNARSRAHSGQHGFVAGCVWGDDSGGWKLQYLDLSEVEKGIIRREERFGYLELGAPLADAVELTCETGDGFTLSVAVLRRFHLDERAHVTKDFGCGSE